MPEEASPAPGDKDEGGGFLDDFTEKLEAFHVLRTSDPEAADAYLASLGGSFAEAEEAIVQQMADSRVLARPEMFVEANRRMVKGIEVLYRNGRRGAPINGWGPLRPVVQLVQIYITSYITRSYVNTLLQNILELYTSRENQAARGSETWHMLYYARWNLDKVDHRFRGDRSVGFLLFGGTVFAAVATGFGEVFTAVVTRDLLLILFSLAMVALILAVGSGIVLSAGIAKRRIAMTTQRPLETLYDVVGAAGIPPRDNAWAFALGAVAVLILIWLVIPGLVIGVIFN